MNPIKTTTLKTTENDLYSYKLFRDEYEITVRDGSTKTIKYYTASWTDGDRSGDDWTYDNLVDATAMFHSFKNVGDRQIKLMEAEEETLF